MTKSENILSWSNKLLDYLLKHRQRHPTLTFWLRQRDRSNRLTDGYWFQGTDDYIFIGMYNRGGGLNKTRSVGFVIAFDKELKPHCKIEIVYKDEKDKRIISFYRKCVASISGFEKLDDTKYNYFYKSGDVFANLDQFLTEHKPAMDNVLTEMRLANLMQIDQESFENSLKRTLFIRNQNGANIATSGNLLEHNSVTRTTSIKMTLNQIFFGPPGTGKTYHTINKAIEIVDRDFYEANKSDRKKLKERFRDLLIKDWDKSSGQIAFCTFHQSFSYEDFVEGIKPVKPAEDDKYLKYRVEDGIFKKICLLSEDNQKSKQIKTDRVLSWNEETFRKASFYKLSLGDINKPEDNEIYEYCISNNCIAMAFGGGFDFKGMDETEVTRKCKELELDPFHAQALNYFVNYLKVGNYVVISKGNRYIRAIGKVTSEYRFEKSAPLQYNNVRSVEWLVVNENVPVTEVYDRNLSQMTIYKLDDNGIKKDFFVKGGQPQTVGQEPDRNYVLIIDEINRGNVSSIFGELITLIEKDKRAGGAEELQVTLPYSKELFKVPGNVYTIGTMNTADRSIEALDTALRRRFFFREMPSLPGIIRNAGSLKPTGKIDHVDIVAMLETINDRIEKLINKDHKIGHAYFMDIKTMTDLKLVFSNKVIPLLEEYFFGDFGKIGLVLGESFIERISKEGLTFATFKDYDTTIVEDLKEKPVYKIKSSDAWDFASIYK